MERPSTSAKPYRLPDEKAQLITVYVSKGSVADEHLCRPMSIKYNQVRNAGRSAKDPTKAHGPKEVEPRKDIIYRMTQGGSLAASLMLRVAMRA